MAFSLALRLLARIVLLGLAVFFTCGSDLVGIGPFLAGILIGGHRFPAGLRSRLIAPDPATAADAPPISRAYHHRAGGRTPRPPAIIGPASVSNRAGRARANCAEVPIDDIPLADPAERREPRPLRRTTQTGWIARLRIRTIRLIGFVPDHPAGDKDCVTNKRLPN